MVSSGMLRGVALVRTDVSQELSASFIRVTRIGELGTTLAVTSNRRKLRRNLRSVLILVALMKEALRTSDTSVLTRPTQRNIPEDTIFQNRNRISDSFLHFPAENFRGIILQWDSTLLPLYFQLIIYKPHAIRHTGLTYTVANTLLTTPRTREAQRLPKVTAIHSLSAEDM
jgi:hypothetical protein